MTTITKIEVAVGRTINVGPSQFEFYRIDVRMTADVQSDEDVEEVYDDLSTEVHCRVADEVRKISLHGN